MKLILALLLGFGAFDDTDWTAIWARVQVLEDSGDGAAAEAWSALAQETEALRRALHDDRDASDAQLFRVALLQRVLAHHDGDQPPALDDAGAPVRYLPGEAFVAARHLDPGDARARAFATAIEEPSDELAVFPVLNAAFLAFVEDEAAWRGPSARAIAEAMHARARATWSVFCLEGIARRQGDYGAADRALVEQIARTALGDERTELLLRRALAAGGAGDRERARDLLGHGLALGATDAYQVLGLEALSRDRRGRARRLFGVLVERDRVQGEGRAPWGLRGWGVSQLAPPPEAPVQARGEGR